MCDNNLLDQILLDFISTFEYLLELKFKLQTILSSGFINIAKARYSMGISFLSSLQYNLNDLDMALAQVSIVHNVPNNAIQFVKINGNTSKTEQDSTIRHRQNKEVNYNETFENGTNQDRMNQIGQKIYDENELLNMNKLNINENSNNETKLEDILNTKGLYKNKGISPSNRGIKNPIKWFGVLVPQPLRQSQKDFTDSLDLILEISTLQIRLEELRKEYILKKKNSLIKS